MPQSNDLRKMAEQEVGGGVESIPGVELPQAGQPTVQPGSMRMAGPVQDSAPPVGSGSIANQNASTGNVSSGNTEGSKEFISHPGGRDYDYYTTSEQRVKQNRETPVMPMPSDKPLRERLATYQTESDKLRRNNIDTADLDAALSEARQQYREGVSRNETLELVQMIGDNLAKLATASYGKKRGVIIPQTQASRIDYAGRNKRLADELEGARGEDRTRRNERAEQGREQRLLDQMSLQPREKAVDIESRKYGDDMAAYRQQLRDNREETRYNTGVSNKNREAGAREYDDVEAEERRLAAETNALESIAGLIQKDKKESRKEADKLAAKAGLDLGAIRESTKKEGALWGTNEDIPSQVQAIRDLIRAKRAERDNLRTRKDIANEMKLGGSDWVTAREKAGQQQQAGKQLSAQQLSDYAKQYNMTEEQATNYLSSQGYTVSK